MGGLKKGFQVGDPARSRAAGEAVTPCQAGGGRVIGRFGFSPCRARDSDLGGEGEKSGEKIGEEWNWVHPNGGRNEELFFVLPSSPRRGVEIGGGEGSYGEGTLCMAL